LYFAYFAVPKYIAALNKKVNSGFAFLSGILLTSILIFALLNNHLKDEIESVKLGNVYAESITYDKLADDVFTTIEYELADGTIATARVMKGSTKEGQPVGKFYIELENGEILEAEIKDDQNNLIFEYEDQITEIVAQLIIEELNALNIEEGDTFPTTVITIDLANASVTNPKIADNAVTSSKIFDGTITDVDISNSAGIGWGKIDKSGSSIADLSTRNASDVNLADIGGYFATDNVEAAISDIADGTTLDSRYLQVLNNLSDLSNVATARTNLGLVSGGAGDIWVDTVGDTMTGTLQIDVATATNEALILKTTDDDTTKNIFEIQDSNGVTRARINSVGQMSLWDSNDKNTFSFTNVSGGGGKLTVRDSLGLPAMDFDSWNRTGVLNLFKENNKRIVFTAQGTSYIGAFSTNKFVIGSDTALGKFTVVGGVATDVQAVIKAAPSQTANLTEWQNSGGGVLAEVQADGDFLSQRGLFPNGVFTNDFSSYTGGKIDWNLSNTQGRVLLGDTGYFNFVDSSNVDLARIQNGASPTFQITTPNASYVSQIIKAAASQTANLTEWQDSLGNVLSGVDERGIPFAHGGSDVDNFFAGNNAGKVDTSGTRTIAIGTNSLNALVSGAYNVGFGYNTLTSLQTGTQNLAFGSEALKLLNGPSYNVALGGFSLASLTTSGSNNVGVGYLAGNRIQSGASNVFIGYQSGYGGAANQTSVDRNIAIGYRSLYTISTGADNNTAIGYQTGTLLTTGDANVLLGYLAGSQLTTESNKLYIANSNTTTPLILGDFTGDGGLTVHSQATTATAFTVKAAASQTANLTEWQDSSGTRFSAINAYGNLGIGSDGGQFTSIFITNSFTSTAVDQFLSGVQTDVNFTANDNTTDDRNFALRSDYTLWGSGAVSSIFGLDSTVDTRGTGNITNLHGQRSRIRKRGNHDIANLYGYRVTLSSTADSTGGTVGNAYGINISGFAQAGAETVTNLYGLWISDQTIGDTLNYAILTNAGNVVFNEGGDADTDFRVAGDTDINLLFTDASADRVGIGTNTPDVLLDVDGDIEGDLVTSSDGSGNVCYTNGGANGGIYLLTRCVSSSARYKENINNSTLGLDSVLSLRAVTFDYKDWYSSDDTDIGFIAEEVEQVSPLLVRYNGEGEVENVKYEKLTALLVKAIQEQQQQITALQLGEQIANGALQIDSLEVQNEAIFNGIITARNNLDVQGTAYFSGNNIGQAVIPIGTTEVQIEFADSYNTEPIVNATSTGFFTGNYWLKDVTQDGFTIELSEAQTTDITFNWNSFGTN